jgi:hypothetical protein
MSDNEKTDLEVLNEGFQAVKNKKGKAKGGEQTEGVLGRSKGMIKPIKSIWIPVMWMTPLMFRT